MFVKVSFVAATDCDYVTQLQVFASVVAAVVAVAEAISSNVHA